MTGAPGYVKGGRRDARDTAPDAAHRSGSAFRRWLGAAVPGARPAESDAIATDAVASGPTTSEPSDAELRATEIRATEIRADAPASATGPDALAASLRRPVPDRDLVALCNRFEGITRQLERLVRTTLDSGPAAGSGTIDGKSPLERAVAEIAARQRALDEDGMPAEPSMFAPVLTPAAAPPAVDLSRLEDQLRAITAQIETLRSPCRAAELAGELRQELRQIGRAVHDLVPRHAFEALEAEVRALSARLDQSRAAAFDPAALAPIEQGLAELRDALRGLAPGELAGSVNTLFHKIDQISAEGLDPAVLHQLQGAVETLRGIVTTVASGDALTALVAEVRVLSERIDHAPLAPATPAADAIANLERQISGIAETLAAQSAEQSAAQTVTRAAADAAVQAAGAAAQAAEAAEAALARSAERIALAAPAAGDATAAPAQPPTLEPLMASLVDRLERFDLMADARAAQALAPIEERIGLVDDKLDRLQAGGLDPAVVAKVEDRIRLLADKLDSIERSALDHPGLAPLEQRVAQLVQKIEQSEQRLEMLPALERGMAELLAHVEALQAARTAPPQPDPALAALARDVESLRQSQDDADRRTRASLEAAHGTLDRMADRLAAIESDLRAGPARSSASVSATPTPTAPTAAVEAAAEPPPFAAAAPATAPLPGPSSARGTGLAIPIGPPRRPAPEPAALSSTETEDGGLPPDAPIEPGSGPPWYRGRSAADRIAASQAALGPTPESPAAAGAKPNFILAARRAAQAASEQASPSPATAETGSGAGAGIRRLSDRIKALFVTSSVLVIALALVPIGLRSLDPGADRPAEVITAAPSSVPPSSAPVAAAPDAKSRAGTTVADLVPPSDLAAAARALSAASPTAKALIDRHLPKLKDETSLLAPPAAQPPAAPPPSVAAPATVPATGTPPVTAPATTAAAPPGAAPQSAAEITGALPSGRGVAPATPLATPPHAAAPARPGAPPAAVPLAPAPAAASGEAWPDSLPAALATKPLAAGVAARNPAAAYEIAMRYAEGRGVAADLAAALPWFLRAAEAGLAPAQFRLGSLYEKGHGVKKDLAEARRWYQAAADRGNANAMHNIAVLYAEGIDGKPDFAAAAQWFQRAARHGVADSQYNLAILHARGIGVEQNLAEAYKWFAIAAQRGDKDAVRKRDDIAQRLDQQSLTAARLAAQSFVPLVAPEEAVTVVPPPGGWEDAVVGPGSRPKPKTRVPFEQAARL